MILLVLLLDANPSSSLEATWMLGLKPSDGVAMLVKEFAVPEGVTILGAQFTNNDPRTVFPEVSLVRGPLSAIGEGRILSSAVGVGETAAGMVMVTWSQPIRAAGEEPYYLAVRFPAGPARSGPGEGPAIGAWDVAQPNGSFLASGLTEPLVPIRADLAMTLSLSARPASEGAAKSSDGTLERSVPGTFLRAGVPDLASGSTRIEFGLERTGHVTLRIYSVSGRLVRVLEQGDLAQGVHHRTWDGRDAEGNEVAAGLYLIALRSGKTSLSQKLVLAQ
jgi:hypothetical protein